MKITKKLSFFDNRVASPSQEVAPVAITRIRPPSHWIELNLNELWQYRDLLYTLVWRDIKVRYKQTAIGAAWAVLQPFLTMVVFTIIFGNLGKLPSDGIPYPLFTFVALLPWQLFSRAINDSGNSLVANQQLITKVYFPRLVIPLASLLSGLVDFAISFLILLGLMLYYGVVTTAAALTLPLFILLALVTALAVGLWLSALNVQYHDVRYTLPFLTQFWMFLTPIAYSSSMVPERWRLLYSLNPMTGVIEGFRWALLGKQGVGPLLLVSTLMVLVLLVGGLLYFGRMEDNFADVI